MGELNKLGAEIVDVNTANGWNVTKPSDWPLQGEVEPYKLGCILALIHSEASEALEAVRKNDRENFAEELADVVIRVLDCAAGLDIDMDGAVRAKIEKNKARGYRHGGKRV